MHCKNGRTIRRGRMVSWCMVALAGLSIGCSSMSGTWYVRAIDRGILRDKKTAEYHELILKSDGAAEAEVLVTKLKGYCPGKFGDEADFYWHIDRNNTNLRSKYAAYRGAELKEPSAGSFSIELTCDGKPLKDMEGQFLLFCEDYTPEVKQCTVHTKWTYDLSRALPSPVVFVARDKATIEKAVAENFKKGQEVAGYKMSHGTKDEYIFCGDSAVFVSRRVKLTEGIRPGEYGFDFFTTWRRHQDTITFSYPEPLKYVVHPGFAPDHAPFPPVDTENLSKLERLSDDEVLYGCRSPERTKPR